MHDILLLQSTAPLLCDACITVGLHVWVCACQRNTANPRTFSISNGRICWVDRIVRLYRAKQQRPMVLDDDGKEVCKKRKTERRGVNGWT